MGERERGTGTVFPVPRSPSAHFTISPTWWLAASPPCEVKLGAFRTGRGVMRVLLSTIGSRGDVQPLVALAVQLRDMGVEMRMCVPPDFRDWIEQLGISVTPIGPELRSTGKIAPSATPITPERRRQMMEGTVATQFETLAAAAKDCDVIVGATALQIAAPSVAEHMGIPYVFV